MMYKLIFLLLLTSCGASFSNPVHVPTLNLSSSNQDTQSSYKEVDLISKDKFTYYIRSIEDKRLNKNFIEKKGESYYSDADIAPVVRESISLTLEKMGFVRSKDSPVTLRLFVTNWSAELKEEMSATLTAKAKISLEVFDPTEKRVYKGEYSGSSELEGPSLNNEDLRAMLSSSMEQAIKQIILDKGLIRVLKSY